jgi:glycosyltransferase involved in cell wall biosynthesis
MKPLIVVLSNSWGGLEQIASHDILELARTGLRPRVLCIEDSPAYQFLKGQDQVDLIPVANAPRGLIDLHFKRILNWLIEEEGVNLLHVHQPNLLSKMVPWLWNYAGVALVVTRHILNDHNKKGLVHSLLYRRVDALIASSDTVRANILATHRIREWKVKVIRYGLDFERFDPKRNDGIYWRQQWGCTPETVCIGLVGRIDPAKGQSEFLKAGAGLLKTVPREKVRFVIVGEETLGSTAGQLSVLQDLVRELHLEENVIFAGFQKDIPSIMRALDIVVMPSLQEAFGLVAIEAMAMERPIIISRGGSAEEIVGEDENYGLLIRPMDAFDLQRQLGVLLKRPKLREEMGRRARVRVSKDYDQITRYQKTLQLYDHVLRKRGL